MFDRILGEATKSGVEVLESEIVGLIPEAALAATTPAALRLYEFSEAQILERRLADIQ